MESVRILAWIALAVPIAASAGEVSVSQAIITGAPGYVVDSLQVCTRRNEALWDRKALIEQDRRLLERESDSIARMRSELEAEWERLDRGNADAVAAYNARSSELNRWVEAHNRRVEELNGAVALLNANSQALVAYCDNLYMAR